VYIDCYFAFLAYYSYMENKVLVAEDDTLLQTILVKNLKDASFDVHAVGDGFEAEVEVKSWKPDIVLLDLLMPTVDGFTVLKNIRANNETQKTHVIILSNLSADETIAVVKKLGVNEYFIKSHVMPQDIVAKLKEFFSSQQN
jgi:two-component system, OmpR family, alkaline phosphatase synthesis response regulator PhoP